MTALITVYTGDGCVGQCDAKCYNAWGSECHCICQGANHGIGRQAAIGNTRDLAESWIEDAQAAGQVITRVDGDRRSAPAPVRPRTRPVTRREPVPPSGVAGVRLPGDMADILRLTAMVAQTGADVIETRDPGPNRRDPGVRVYMLVRAGQDGGSQ